jgi:hypothetical protein
MNANGDLLDLGPPGPVLGVRAFHAGDWNDVPTTPADVRAMADNFATLTAGDPPFYVPFVSINHDNGLAFGRVTRCEADADGVLTLDLDGVPLTVRQWMRADRLTAPSIEFWDPLRFVGPAGEKWPTPVLKCCTLLGNDAPGVKGLPSLSAATYPGLDDAQPTDATPAALTTQALKDYRPAEGVSKFSDQAPATRPGVSRMTPARQKMVDALVAAGFPQELFTDAIPDPFLEAMVGFVQKASQPQNPNADDADKDKGDADKAKAMSDDADKDDGVQKYRDATGRLQTMRVPKALAPMAAAFAAQMDALHAANTATAAAQQRTALESRKVRVRAFRDEMTTPDAKGVARMTPAMFDAVEPMLLAADDAGVRKFADGKTDGTELEERMAGLRSSFAGVRKFGDAMPQTKVGTSPQVVKPVANPALPPRAGEISDSVKAMLASAGFGHHVAALPQ